MQHSSAELLQFDELKQLVGRYVSGPFGRLELELLQPSSDREALEGALSEVAEAVAFARVHGRLPLGGLSDNTEAIQKLRIEGVSLDGKEIAEFLVFLDRATQVKSLLDQHASDFSKLSRYSERIGDFRSLLRTIGGKVLPNGLVADDASVALSRLRREIDRQQRQIQQTLDRFLRAHREEGVLQEEYVAIRNDRFVVPVVSSQKRRLDGVIHGASSSGQTLFLEPLETIGLNNDLVRLREEEMREVHRILREITAELRAHADAIRQTLQVVREIDLLFAKASFALDFDCVIPTFNAPGERAIRLKEARHPLLQDVLRKQGKRVTPVSLELSSEQRMLLISGPNTGGKTVSMKTVGLLSLMAHAALPVPATLAEFPIFDQVLADIGDQQSIEQSLSSFSAHIARIREMVEDATDDTLVLLDELGRATDPEEGGALGVAILDHFRGIRSFVLSSTHLLALKVYGANTPAVLNGSMGFDDETLQPTYVLRLGAPGKSAGLDIATRLGLPPRLIRRAREAMSSTERDISRFLSELHQQIETSSALEKDLKARTEALAVREATLEREWERRESAKIRELERRYDDLSAAFEAQARETIDSIREIGENRKAHEQAMRKISKTKREFQEQMQVKVFSGAPQPEQFAKPKLAEGARVVLRGISQPARVRRIINEDVIEVDAGFLKMQVSVGDVVEVLPEGGGAQRKLPQNISFQQQSGPKWDVSYQEINVIGQRAEEAIDQVDRFIDRAALASVDRVRIVHGHGMGILKKAVADLLAKSPHVQKYYAASSAEGGSGATIAELRAV
jgi:DNA mismatch repair protein MutS2